MRRDQTAGAIVGRGCVLLMISAITFAACGDGSESADDDASRGIQASQDPGPIHVHGLGINPGDGALFIATHTGLFRAPEGVSKAERVADRYQDTMGFTIVGPDRFLGSGHPDAREELPPFLGLIRSSDAGESWDSVSLLGGADFHVLEAAGETVYGYGSDFKTREQQLLASVDSGQTWQERPLPEPPSDDPIEESLRSLAIDPGDPSTIVASGQEALWFSDDQGRQWSFLTAGNGLLVWAESGEVYVVGERGAVKRSADRGRSWETTGSIGGEPAALEAVGDALYVALHNGTIKQSTDGGVNWTVRSAP